MINGSNNSRLAVNKNLALPELSVSNIQPLDSRSISNIKSLEKQKVI